MNFRIIAEADAEMHKAANYYDENIEGLGGAYLHELEKLFQMIFESLKLGVLKFPETNFCVYSSILFLLSILLFGCVTNPTIKPSKESVVTLINNPFVIYAGDLSIEMDFPEKRLFKIANFLSTTPLDRLINESISNQLFKLGYKKAPSADEATIAVWYSYARDDKTIWGFGHKGDIWAEKNLIESNPELVFPEFFTITLIDLENSSFPQNIDVIWRGDASAEVVKKNLPAAVPIFVDKIFSTYTEETQVDLSRFIMREEILNYITELQSGFQDNWILPIGSYDGISCDVTIRQNRRAIIQSYKIQNCDKWPLFKRSIQRALNKSPQLPFPRRELYKKVLTFNFKG